MPSGLMMQRKSGCRCNEMMYSKQMKELHLDMIKLTKSKLISLWNIYLFFILMQVLISSLITKNKLKDLTY